MNKKMGLILGHHNLGLHLFTSAIKGKKLPAPDARKDWLAPIHAWDIMGNDKFADCVFVSTLNAIRLMAANTKRPIPDFKEHDALALYSAITGFDPSDPSTDQGSSFDAAGTYWQSVGINGEKIVGRMRVNPGNVDLIKLAIEWFGFVMAGLALPDDALEQFDRQQPWTVTQHRPSVQNGHEVMIGAFDGNYFDCITWGKRHSMSADYLLAAASSDLGGDIQIIVGDPWIRPNGMSPSQLHLETLRRDAGLIA